MPAVTFSGLASGLDTRALIDAILSVERRPIERLQQRQALFNQRRAALDELRGKLSAFDSALRDLPPPARSADGPPRSATPRFCAPRRRPAPKPVCTPWRSRGSPPRTR